MEKTFTLGQVFSAGAIGLLTGYFISRNQSQKRSSGSSRSKASKNANQKKSNKNDNKSLDPTLSTKPKKQIEGEDQDGEDDEEDDDNDEDDDDDDDDFTDQDTEDEDGDDLLVEFDLHEEYKMVLVIRSDLGMGKGKAAAQCCHATLANYKELLNKSPQTLKRWEYHSQAKITLKVDSEEEMQVLRLLLLQAQAKSLGLAAHSIQDAGRTQIARGSRTVLAVGPGPVSVINSVTGKLKLY
ncbi:hypothetical protein BGZ65_009812 [Modicella reniformis]|uniref:peptidyl-tRNA hydrolase n=1 Tax=Modicella reniformis TaxID=1440133 RepID=A0A9P6IQN3_9FUNG|nr:hypothetical protein BGZ65_009812 [Modicella reniformis]